MNLYIRRIWLGRCSLILPCHRTLRRSQLGGSTLPTYSLVRPFPFCFGPEQVPVGAVEFSGGRTSSSSFLPHLTRFTLEVAFVAGLFAGPQSGVVRCFSSPCLCAPALNVGDHARNLPELHRAPTPPTTPCVIRPNSITVFPYQPYLCTCYHEELVYSVHKKRPERHLF